MKKNLLLLMFMTLVFVFRIYAQANETELIEYSKDSIPVLVKFKMDEGKYSHSDAKEVIKKYLKLSKDDELKIKKSFTDDLGFKHVRFQHYFAGLKINLR